MAQLSFASSRIWLDTADPTSTTPNIEMGNWFLNTVTPSLWMCVNGTPGSLVWKQISFS